MSRIERRADPVLVVVGNATLLGIGYIAQRRFGSAVMAIVGAGLLVSVLAVEPGTRLWPVALAAWWAAIILHSLWISRSGLRTVFVPDEPPTRTLWAARCAAIGLAGLLLAAAIVTRTEAEGIVAAGSQAHGEGDCEEAVSEFEHLNAAHRITANAATGRAADQAEACEVLATIDEETGPDEEIDILGAYLELDGALWEEAGYIRAELLLESAVVDGAYFSTDAEQAFRQLESLLETDPSQSDRVTGLMEDFFAGLGEYLEPCSILEVYEWTADQESSADELRTSIAAAAEQVPVRLIECARGLASDEEHEAAIERYQRFLDEYPEHELTADAVDELAATEVALAEQEERARLTELLGSGDYCGDPVPFSQAAPYEGVESDTIWPVGSDEVEEALPVDLNTDSLVQATAVLCVSGPERGSLLETCEYWAITDDPNVELYANRFEVRMYELRTGDEVRDYSVEIGGECPEEIEYSYGIGTYDTFPDSMEAPYDSSDLDALFDRLR